MTEYPPIHAPSRPDWLCMACAEAWPCKTRKSQLRDLFQDNTAGLINYLAQYLTDANVELGHLNPIEVSERFVEWCTHPGPDSLHRVCAPVGNPTQARSSTD